MRVLIVEDNEISAGILESNLRQRNYDAIVAQSGTEAMRLLETHWDIDIVIADIMVPEIDGLELVRRMREDSLWQEIPVIICTSLADSEHVAMAAKLGCRHYLLKPIDRSKLLMMVEKLLIERKRIAILDNPEQISAKYGISGESLEKIFRSFAKLAEEFIAFLKENASNQGNVVINIGKIAEGAATLGAARLLSFIQPLQEKGSEFPASLSEREALLRELTLILHCLDKKYKTASDQSKAAPAAQPT
jgi:DNA-binding response OmpR family regulator